MTETLEETTTNIVMRLSHITKQYPTRKETGGLALSDASLDLATGEFVSLVGPSGCGKTTLMKIASGLLSPTHGTVLFEDNEGAPLATQKGVVFQSPVLLPWRTVLENIVLPAQVQKTSVAAARKRAQELLELVQIPQTANKYPGELSGGMQQRVNIARALLNKPGVLFMDEPFGALDAMTRENLNAELQDIHSREGITVLFVTHDIPEAIFLSDRIAVMSAGPGRITEIVDVPLPRPRSAGSRADKQFHEIELHVRSLLHPQNGTAS